MRLLPAWRMSIWVQPGIPLLALLEALVAGKFLVRSFRHLRRLTHIFRALMGLYLGMVTFCIIAAFTPEWRHVAVIWAVFFAYSLAIGRILSLIVDGMPSPILLFYMAVELIVGTLGLLVLIRERQSSRS
jgi:Domain of unknown function (DUF4345)